MRRASIGSADVGGWGAKLPFAILGESAVQDLRGPRTIVDRRTEVARRVPIVAALMPGPA
jgi:hypothetical protein